MRHVALPYDSDERFAAVVLPHVREALDEGRRVLVVTCTARLGLLAEALGRDAGRIDGRIAAAWYTHPQRTLAAYHEYATEGPALIVGEPVWAGRGRRETRAWIRYESVLNVALRGTGARLLCPYDSRGVPPDVLAHVALTHPLVLGPGGEAASDAYVRPHELVLDGDHAPLPDPDGRVEALRFTAPELKALRHAVGDYARAAGMDRDLISSLVLGVSEIAANSVEHGAGHGTIRMWVNGRELVCEIADPGGALDDPLPGYLPPEPEASRGYGLWISRQLCDHVELRADRGTLRVRLHMRLNAG
ncbi:anti-sigma regulatory factor (Ser/Thr protein kinase) [Nonomuraea muscovyensis]|uniref:Anti-sigma regulatory factor (Ser/Thr protein kinase) n=1 Tax=Nonomuraea muscovyensis TaxID=1124761 RepID=A0A7X0F370_9ACTN|nr:sensor histidine kinase [Nonomuraea muscovyensis]MBB6351501.1 anti-sigma regulatory factor (Ser/Thr protein kinase) [Nonomuraea muscovyensis]